MYWHKRDAVMITRIGTLTSRFSVGLAVVVGLLMPSVSHAYTAVAGIQGHTVSTIYAGWNYSAQKTADEVALGGCRKTAKENGLSSEASKCEVLHRQKSSGAGAMLCGKTGCSIRTGYDTQQEAVDDAFQHCVQSKFSECPKENITSWWDEAGYPKQRMKKVVATETCGPPPGRTVRSTTHCDNGDCTRTFENGCTVRFQAPYCRDPFSGQWEWKPDGC